LLFCCFWSVTQHLVSIMAVNDPVEMILLEEKKLTNRMVLGLYDHSRRIAGDRWFVKLQGRARIVLTPDFFEHVREDDPELLEIIRERLGNELIFTLGKERHFISEEKRELVMAELLARVHENMLVYLNSPSFPGKLFRKQYEEQKQKLLLERAMKNVCTEEEEEQN
jgi:hypothetical protein